MHDGNRFAETLKGKSKSQWNNSSATEDEDYQLKVMHLTMLYVVFLHTVCGLLY